MADNHTLYTPASMLDFLTHVEQREGEAHGWGNLPMLYDITLDVAPSPARLTFTEIGPWQWTPFFFGIGPEGATGDVNHDLGLYADRAEPLPHFLAAVFRYETPATDDSKARRVLLAVDERARLYRVTRVEGDATATAEQLSHLDEDEHLLALNKIADALRGGPAIHEYAFDAKLMAVVRVKATSEQAARELIGDTCDIEVGTIAPNVEISSADFDGEYDLFEVDGDDPA
ncbi:hypothetical protein [Nonomuraea sp. NPDC005650]|uniref:hypothetical protein n=1 Tax=Nonomuraea sp. NPDC005650 TaxID=3157045 RepID=UPI0033B7961F